MDQNACSSPTFNSFWLMIALLKVVSELFWEKLSHLHIIKDYDYPPEIASIDKYVKIL
jgi:hypothetical protein